MGLQGKSVTPMLINSILHEFIFISLISLLTSPDLPVFLLFWYHKRNLSPSLLAGAIISIFNYFSLVFQI